jgi:proteasome accessory factor C
MSTSAAQVSRMLALVPYLHEHQGIPVAELAKEFGVTPRVIQQDLSLLIMTGVGRYGGEMIDIDQYALEDDGVVDISDADFMRRPLRLNLAEAAALIVALRTLRASAAPTQVAIIDGALAKLESAALDEAAPAVDVHVEPSDPAIHDALSTAIADGRRVRLRYAGAARDELTERDVDPIRLLTERGHVYLEGWCHRAEDMRFFRLDRILDAVPLPTPAADHAATPRALGADLFAPPSGGASAVFDLAPAAHWLVEELWAEVLQTHGKVLRVRIRGGDSAWLLRLALRHAESVTVVEPPELRAEVAAAADAALAEYDRQ